MTLTDASISGLRLIDLSVVLGPSDSEAVPVEIAYMGHEFGGEHLAQLVGMESCLLHGGLGWASERVSAITHSGTHVDAPFHYAPECGGLPSRTIDEIPVEWFWGPGVCVSLEQHTQKNPITVEELEDFERRSGHRIVAGEIVFFRTGAEVHHGTALYMESGRGLSRPLVEALCERGVRVFGTDAWSIDPPFRTMHERLASHGPESVWEAHFTGRKREFCVLEKLCNLHLLPATGFWVACFPVKVQRGSGAWTRAVAFLEGT